MGNTANQVEEDRTKGKTLKVTLNRYPEVVQILGPTCARPTGKITMFTLTTYHKDIIRLSSPDGGPGSADEFLPCLIYVMLKSTPTMLNSNIQ